MPELVADAAACLLLAVACAACTTASSRAPPAARGPGSGGGDHGRVVRFPGERSARLSVRGRPGGKGYPVRTCRSGQPGAGRPGADGRPHSASTEYAGSALDFASLGRVHATADVATTASALAEFLAARGLVAGHPAAAQDGNAIVVTAATAARYRLRTISDLARVAGRLVLGRAAECRERPYCLPGLRVSYGLRFREFVPLDAGGPLTRQALTAGDIDVALLFATDPAIRRQAPGGTSPMAARYPQPAENNRSVLRRGHTAHRFGPRPARRRSTPCRARLFRRGAGGPGRPSQLNGRCTARRGGRGPGLKGWSGRGRGRHERQWCACRSTTASRRPPPPSGGPTPAPPDRCAAPLPRRIAVTTTAWVALAATLVTGAFLLRAHTLARGTGPGEHMDVAATGDGPDAVADRRGEQDQHGRPELVSGDRGGGSSADRGIPALAAPAGACFSACSSWRSSVNWIYNGLSRPRPFGVPIIGRLGRVLCPSAPVAALTFFLMGAVYCLAVPGRPRSYAKAGAAAVVALSAWRGSTWPSTIQTTWCSASSSAWRYPWRRSGYFTPNEVFPIVYRRGRAAHIDVTGRRGAAIGGRPSQLAAALEVRRSSESSAGSTPRA